MYQIAHILERAHSVELAKNATLKMQAETLRNSLLSSISHDLRNPLATLVGAAYILIRHAGFVVTHRQLLEKVWGPSYVEHNHYLRIYMGQLRHKLEADPARPKYLLTEAGVGYRLSEGEGI